MPYTIDEIRTKAMPIAIRYGVGNYHRRNHKACNDIYMSITEL